MRSIRIENPPLNSYISDISVDYSSGTSVTLRSNNSFAASDLAVFGNPTEELTELKKINSLSGDTGLVIASDLKFQHNKGTPVFKTLWDFVEIEGRSSSAGVFAVITQSGIQWDSKSKKTIYFHSDGTDDWEYRFRFYNSVTTLYSEYSPTLTGAGFTQSQMGYIIRDARLVAGDEEGRILTTKECLRVLTRGKNIIRAHNPKYWFWRVDGYQSGQYISSVTPTSVYDLADITNFGIIDLIEYRYTSGSIDEKYVLQKKSDVEFLALTRDLTRPQEDYPTFYRLLPPDSSSTAGYFEIDTIPENNSVGKFYISHYKNEPNYTSVDDTTSVIMPEILEDYLISKIYAAKGNDTMAKEYYGIFTGPQQRKKTLGIQDLSGIALLDELDRQSKDSQGQPKQLWRFRGQRAVSRLYGRRSFDNPDYIRENYFNGRE